MQIEMLPLQTCLQSQGHRTHSALTYGTDSCFRIVVALSHEERGLFRERIRFLDKKIHPGLTKLSWAPKGISEFFITECRMHASKVSARSEAKCEKT